MCVFPGIAYEVPQVRIVQVDENRLKRQLLHISSCQNAMNFWPTQHVQVLYIMLCLYLGTSTDMACYGTNNMLATACTCGCAQYYNYNFYIRWNMF